MRHQKQSRSRKPLVALAFVLVAAVAVYLYSQPQTSAVNGAEIVSGIQRYCQEHRPLPKTVTFSELISRGYLPADTMLKFGASEILVSLDANPLYPQKFLLDATMTDGTHQTLLSDGSVQQISKKRTAEMTNSAAETNN